MPATDNLYAQLLEQAGRREQAVALWHCRGAGEAKPVT
jgi:hypothetical protein